MRDTQTEHLLKNPADFIRSSVTEMGLIAFESIVYNTGDLLDFIDPIGCNNDAALAFLAALANSGVEGQSLLSKALLVPGVVDALIDYGNSIIDPSAYKVMRLIEAVPSSSQSAILNLPSVKQALVHFGEGDAVAKLEREILRKSAGSRTGVVQSVKAHDA